ncbi:glycerophosphodiester phosphodiesterase family protein [Qipengyuania sp. YIM B01966]|uniref:glycerophosphodiester phosphodiesterase family protein n=1 Tax=Qipengyuania sp. YIM B01966 TaxID=2778646 RepID=UPI001F440C37|nr:glycerophosphodiester phosphodiesterase family protein [Qipengyuania sp. YIM B01966]
MLLRLIDGFAAPPPAAARVGWLCDWQYAHRGVHDRGAGGTLAENSLPAFAEAMRRGLGIECDIQRSADGRAMVFHDWELDRLTAQTGPVVAHTADALARMTLSGTEATIPTLEMLLRLIGGKVALLIEIKSRAGRPVSTACLAVRRALEGYYGPHAVMSFDPRVSAWFARHAPHIVRGLVVTEERARGFGGRARRHLALWQAKPEFLAYDVRDLPSRFAASQRARGLPVLTWTVRTQELAQRAALHADAPIAEGDGLG